MKDQPQSSPKVLRELRETVKVTTIWNGVPVTSISKLVSNTVIVDRQTGKERKAGLTSKNTMRVNGETMKVDNATAAYELIMIGAI